MEQQRHRACKQTKSKKKQNKKSRHIQIDHAFFCSIKPTNNDIINHFLRCVVLQQQTVFEPQLPLK